MNYTKMLLNFLAVVLLIGLSATPFYFARNFAKVAGVKSSSPYLLVSQIEKFPNITFSQSSDAYRISLTKQGPSQAFLGVLIINNPTDRTQTYSLEVTSGQNSLFFGEDPNNLLTSIMAPSLTSVPVSLYSPEEASGESQTVEFQIHIN